MRAFVQTFVLAPQLPKKYYVHNDIFRYQDDDLVSESETTEVMGEAEGAAISEPLPEEINYHRPPSAGACLCSRYLYSGRHTYTCSCDVHHAYDTDVTIHCT